MKDLVKDFENYIRIDKGYSESTIEAYSRDLNKFIMFLKKEKITSFADVEATTLYSFLANLSKEGLSATTRERTLCAIKSFFKFLCLEKILETNVAKFVPIPKKWKKIPTVLNIEEINLILKKPNTKTLSGKRDLAILELLYGSGLRASKAASLKVQCIQEDIVTVYGKGGRERKVPVTSHFLSALKNYWDARGPILKDEYVFESNRRTPLNRISIWKIIKKYSSGLNKNIHPHTFRHCFAVHML